MPTAPLHGLANAGENASASNDAIRQKLRWPSLGNKKKLLIILEERAEARRTGGRRQGETELHVSSVGCETRHIFVIS